MSSSFLKFFPCDLSGKKIFLVGKRRNTAGVMAASMPGIAGFAFSNCIVHIPYDEPKFKSITFKVEKNKYLSASFDASEFNPQQSGHIEVRFYLPNATEVLNFLNQKGKT